MSATPRVALTGRTSVAIGAALAGIATAALAAQVLPVASPEHAWPLYAMRPGLTMAWLALIALTWAEALALLTRRFAPAMPPDWRLAVLVSSVILPRFRDNLFHGPVAALWLVALLVCGASILREVGGNHFRRTYWITAAVVLAPWGLIPALPAWP